MPRHQTDCPQCGTGLLRSKYDTTFRLPDGLERLCFSIPGALCRTCRQLYIEPELIDLLDLSAGRCVFAIESDQVLRQQAQSPAE